MIYIVRVEFNPAHKRLLCMYVKKQGWFGLRAEKFFCEAYSNSVSDVSEVPVEKLKQFILKYLPTRFGDKKDLFTFKMDDSGKEQNQ